MPSQIKTVLSIFELRGHRQCGGFFLCVKNEALVEEKHFGQWPRHFFSLPAVAKSTTDTRFVASAVS